jgi:DNA polymerase V
LFGSIKSLFLDLLKSLVMQEVNKIEKVESNSYSIQAVTGFPSPATDYLQERIDLNKEFIKHPLSTFIFECVGNSMINAFIPPKAKLIIDRTLKPKNGDIILAVLNGEFTIRRLIQNEYRCFLRPENPKYKEVEITAELQMEVWGVVAYIITDTKDLL